ncbi:MAG: AAA family ATPase [Planctomycetales bacterium]|nr:AAA family ATPase [Planctomycetales bacterium]
MKTITPRKRCAPDGDLALSQEVIGLLQRQSADQQQAGEVQLIETHISWVFLTNQFAYKLKKPVRFDFVDFSTAELRRKACENEVTLNRRLAPGVYLGIVPVVVTASGQLAIGRVGVPVDWLVKMRRLSAGNALDTLIREDRVGAVAIEQLARTLSDFYHNAPPVTMIVDDYRRNIEHHVIANRDELLSASHHLDEAAIHRVHSAQLRVLKLAPDILDERVRNGRIIEGHGDLRPEHIYFNPSPLVIDCIEFSQEFRTLDVVDELAFLAMECDFLGADDITDPIFEHYFEQSGDSPPPQVISFYQIYRACVRAKVCALRAEQLVGEARERLLESASTYLNLAHRYSLRLGPPVLILIHGLPGTGKSTIARTISEQLGFALLQTDAIRRSVIGASDDKLNFNEGAYRPENRRRVYEAMHEQAEGLLSNGTSVVLDGNYLEADLRVTAANLANRHHAEFVAAHCECLDEIALERIITRSRNGGALSETRPEFFDRQRQSEEPDPPGLSSLVIDTSTGSSESLQSVFETLRSRCFADVFAMAPSR